MAAALASGAVGADELVTVPSSVTVVGHRFEDTPAHDPVEWGLIDILTVSSNVGAITVAQRVGEEAMNAMIRSFGFGSVTALDFKGEAKGILAPLQAWNKLTLPTVAIGQGLAVTPLQLLQAYNTIANDGVLMPLRLVSEISDVNVGVPVGAGADGVRVLDAQSAEALREMLVSVVQHGTGRRAAMAGFIMGGKTGTAWQPCDVGYECVNDEKEFVGRHYTATFVGIVSNGDGPVLSVLVVIDKPRGVHVYGGRLSAPVVRQVAEYALRQLRMPAISGTPPDQRHRAEPAQMPALIEDTAGRSEEGP